MKDEQKQVCAVYLGGGTPTALTDEQLFTVMQAIKDAFGTGYEYTLEAGRPDAVTEEKLSLSQKFGVNRLCINPQTMQDRTLQRIGRRHTAAEIAACYTLARKFGFSHINADIIAGRTRRIAGGFCQYAFTNQSAYAQLFNLPYSFHQAGQQTD